MLSSARKHSIPADSRPPLANSASGRSRNRRIDTKLRFSITSSPEASVSGMPRPLRSISSTSAWRAYSSMNQRHQQFFVTLPESYRHRAGLSALVLAGHWSCRAIISDKSATSNIFSMASGSHPLPELCPECPIFAWQKWAASQAAAGTPQALCRPSRFS